MLVLLPPLISPQPSPLYGKHNCLRPEVFCQLQEASCRRLARNPQDIVDPLFCIILEQTQLYGVLHKTLVSQYGYLSDMCGRQASLNIFTVPFCDLFLGSLSAGLVTNVPTCPSINIAFRPCLWTHSLQIFPYKDAVPAPIPERKC